MKKKFCLVIQMLLLVWFFLSMVGLRLGDKYLVTSAYNDDSIFFIIYSITLLLFIFKEQVGKWIMAIWLSMWLITQFLSHEWYTIFNKGYMGLVDVKIKYFADTIHWLDIEDKYVPDLYHTILHILILSGLIMTIIYIKKPNCSSCTWRRNNSSATKGASHANNFRKSSGDSGNL